MNPHRPALGLVEWLKRIKGIAREWLRRIERKATTWLIDPLFFALRPVPEAQGALLLVRVDAIGDFVMWLDAAKEFRRLFPDRRIVLVANALCLGLAERLPHWDEVWGIDLKRFERVTPYRYRMLAKLRAYGFGTAIQPTYSRLFVMGDSLVRASGARERVGSVGDLSNMGRLDHVLANAVYTRLLPSARTPMTEIERNAEFIALLQGRPFAATCPQIPQLGDLPADLSIDEKYLVAFPGASVSLRQWSIESFAAVAKALRQSHGLKVVLCGSAAERPLCDRLSLLVGGPVVNLAGRTTLWQFAEVVRGAQLLVGNETSAVHISAAVATPAVCVLGGGHFGRFLPYSIQVATPAPLIPVFHRMTCFDCNWHCSQPHPAGSAVPCVARVTIDRVLRASHEAIAS